MAINNDSLYETMVKWLAKYQRDNQCSTEVAVKALGELTFGNSVETVASFHLDLMEGLATVVNTPPALVKDFKLTAWIDVWEIHALGKTKGVSVRVVGDDEIPSHTDHKLPIIVHDYHGQAAKNHEEIDKHIINLNWDITPVKIEPETVTYTDASGVTHTSTKGETIEGALYGRPGPLLDTGVDDLSFNRGTVGTVKISHLQPNDLFYYPGKGLYRLLQQTTGSQPATVVKIHPSIGLNWNGLEKELSGPVMVKHSTGDANVYLRPSHMGERIMGLFKGKPHEGRIKLLLTGSFDEVIAGKLADEQGTDNPSIDQLPLDKAINIGYDIDLNVKRLYETKVNDIIYSTGIGTYRVLGPFNSEGQVPAILVRPAGNTWIHYKEHDFLLNPGVTFLSKHLLAFECNADVLKARISLLGTPEQVELLFSAPLEEITSKSKVTNKTTEFKSK